MSGLACSGLLTASAADSLVFIGHQHSSHGTFLNTVIGLRRGSNVDDCPIERSHVGFNAGFREGPCLCTFVEFGFGN